MRGLRHKACGTRLNPDQDFHYQPSPYIGLEFSLELLDMVFTRKKLEREK